VLISAVGYPWSFMLAGVGLLVLGQWFAGRVKSHAGEN